MNKTITGHTYTGMEAMGAPVPFDSTIWDMIAKINSIKEKTGIRPTLAKTYRKHATTLLSVANGKQLQNRISL